MSLLLLFPGASTGAPSYSESQIKYLAKIIEESNGISLVLTGTASGNALTFGEVTGATPNTTPTKPTMVIQDDGAGTTKLWVFCPTTGSWLSVTLS